MTREIDGITYYKDSKGAWVPSEQVKDTDKLRDQMVNTIADKLMELRTHMIRVKADILEDIAAFMETMADEYGVKLGGLKGNLSFSSYDGNIKLQYYCNDYLTFNEGIHVAKSLIDEYLADATKDASPAIRQIVQAAFNMRQGRMDVKAILKLRDIKENDPRWVKAMQIIDESKQWNSGRRSLRFYVKNKSTNGMDLVPLDFSLLLGEELEYEEDLPSDAQKAEDPADGTHKLCEVNIPDLPEGECGD